MDGGEIHNMKTRIKELTDFSGGIVVLCNEVDESGSYVRKHFQAFPDMSNSTLTNMTLAKNKRVVFPVSPDPKLRCICTHLIRE